MIKKLTLALVALSSLAIATPALANSITPDGSLEYATSNKSFMTVVPGCAWNPKTGLTQPFVNLFDNGIYLLNVSVNNIPLVQLSRTRRSTPIYLSAGTNTITAANGRLSVDTYSRNGGTGTCTL